MQLQRSLAGLPGIQDAGVIMGTDSNKELLAHINLDSPEVRGARPDDLVIVVRAEDRRPLAGVSQVDQLTRRKSGSTRIPPAQLGIRCEMLPDAGWVMVSVAGRYAAGFS
jgi:FdrA protein